MWLAYIANTVACLGVVSIVSNHMGLAPYECILLGFSLAWFWGKI